MSELQRTAVQVAAHSIIALGVYFETGTGYALIIAGFGLYLATTNYNGDSNE